MISIDSEFLGRILQIEINFSKKGKTLIHLEKDKKWSCDAISFSEKKLS